jgi:aspartyl protease family protein
MKNATLAAAVWTALPLLAFATDVTVVGLFPGKAVVTVNRGAPRTLSVGEKVGEVKLLSVGAGEAVLEIDGEKRTLAMGQHFETPPASSGASSVSIAQDGSGHFSVDGQVNGGHVRFLVDTGATTVALPAADARRLGIDLAKARPFMVQTANGTVAAYRVVLDSVAVGGITLHNVEAMLLQDSPPLLGMSFLNRTEMRRDGAMMTLTRRY